MAKPAKLSTPASTATMRRPGAEYSRNAQTLCCACLRRVQWNGQRWIHLTVYARFIHEAIPDLDLVADSSDPWLFGRLVAAEASAP